MRESLVQNLDKACGVMVNRSQFLRTAVAEKLRSMGIELHPGDELPPDRRGKGGPQRRSYRSRTTKSQSDSQTTEYGPETAGPITETT